MPVKKRTTRKLTSVKSMFEWEAAKRSNDENHMEWLYFESLRLAKLTPNEQANHAHDLNVAKAGAHHWLIGKGPRPSVWRFRLKSSFVKRAKAVIPVKDGDGGTALSLVIEHPTRRVLSWDPEFPEEELIAQFRHVIKKERAALNRRRAAGGGRRRSLDRMDEALRVYERWTRSEGGLSHKEIGFDAKTFDPIIDGDPAATASDHGQKLMDRARLMIRTAKAGPRSWMKTFTIQ